MPLIEVQFATRRVADKIEGRGLTLTDCIEILENDPYEIRSSTDSYGNPKYAAYGQTYDGMNALVIYVIERPELYKILSARKNLSRAEIRRIRRRRKT
jgi:uncharacterized DUF497 family protein